MASGDNKLTPKGVLSTRRLALLGGVAVLGLAAWFTMTPPAQQPSLPSFSTAAFAQNVTEEAKTVQRPVGFADIVAKVKPAVISVRVKMEDKTAESMDFDSQDLPPGLERFFRQFGMPEGRNGNGNKNAPLTPRGRNFTTGQGSGFFISPDGYAVTNNHVVENATEVEVKTDDGKTYKAKVIGTDPRTDLALIKIDGRSDFPYAKLSDKNPRIGDWVLAVGNPFGLGGTVTAGIVSANGRDIGAGPYDDFIQIDAPVNKGNSGGPSFDVDGNVIGVNTAIFSPSGGSVGIAFDIPAETVRTVVKQLQDHGKVARGWIGVQIQPVTPQIADSLGLKKAEGALVADVQSGSPAAKAGMQSGTVIQSVNGQPIRDARDLAKRIGSMAPGSTVHLGVVVKGSQKTIDLTLGELPAQKEAAKTQSPSKGESNNVAQLGLTLAPANSVSGAGSDGVVVVSVDPSGAAADAGLKTGDVILSVAGKPVSSPADVRKALSEVRSQGKHNALVQVKTSRGTEFVALPVGEG
ncbi:MAG TPA: Do family serine endopeptidase [Xanthobacteraceae bacterium]|nr:Do family serine endopeptidase [Xanthobacteraceae bacterium]